MPNKENARNARNARSDRIEEQDVLSVEDWLHYIGNYRDDKKEKIIKFVFTWMKYNNWYSRTYNKRWDRVGAIALSNKKDAVIVYDEELKDEFISSFSNIEVSFDGKR
ncbi:MAG: hypothetical protein IJZ30_03050 [Alphaproteobacteria bacterium]|nr:hypothetical protein [Alphaproteobacteria bacterium]